MFGAVVGVAEASCDHRPLSNFHSEESIRPLHREWMGRRPARWMRTRVQVTAMVHRRGNYEANRLHPTTASPGVPARKPARIPTFLEIPKRVD